MSDEETDPVMDTNDTNKAMGDQDEPMQDTEVDEDGIGTVANPGSEPTFEDKVKDALIKLASRDKADYPIEQVYRARHAQVEEQGFTPAHDVVTHAPGVLASAGMAYLKRYLDTQYNAGPLRDATSYWPFLQAPFSPVGPPRQVLVDAAALILAEIDRIDLTEELNRRLIEEISGT